MEYKEIVADLFSLPKHYALAHCIAADAIMGAGIAVEFTKRYKGLRPKLQSQPTNVGEVVLYQENNNKNKVFNLITKYSSYNKPTRKAFNQTILQLKQIVIDENITHIGMPLIGSGLDRLDWNDSRKWIQEVFQDTDVKIVVCRWP
ncbi:macro domain-containing protein [Solibacillus sp. FSL H8-0523]|uniref:macro domain-containing protein n=1 Tax=Solibacillus sp. FSL H8-0523 TaxID=2954511 RepID=UPI003100CEC9